MSLFSTLVPLPQADVIAILDSDGNQILDYSSAIAVDVNESSNFLTHPVENNFVISDGKVINPIVISYDIFFDSENYNRGYDDIKFLYLASERLTIQTRTSEYPDMVITAMPHREDSEVFDALVINIQLEEAIQTSTVIEEIPQDQRTQNRGRIQPEEASPEDTQSGSVAFNAFFG